MLNSRRKRTYSTRANLMVFVGSALYFLILVLALYVMDRQVYSAAKLEIIRENFLEIFTPPDILNDQARRALYSSSENLRELESRNLEKSLRTIVDGPTSMYAMSLVDETGKAVVNVENLRKLTTMNTWDNNLFVRNFQGRTSQNVSPYRSAGETTSTRAAYLTGSYTSPVGVEEIEELTRRYRVYAALISAAWILAWLGIYYYLLRPVRNVTLKLDQIRSGPPSLIPNARAALERGYNDLAASALLQLVEERLTAAARPLEDGDETNRPTAIRQAMEMAATGLGAGQIRVGILASPDNAHAVTEQYEYTAPQVAQPRDLPPLVCPVNREETQVVMYDDNSGFTYHGPLAAGCLQADCVYSGGRLQDPEYYEYLVRACEALRSGFVAFQAYREHLFRERSEANISLSRNMGHDLTNIIATSKLELMGITRILEGAPAGTVISEPRASILQQSVRGLLESTRLMQEMVNIYRSFSYVKRPAYERRALVPLVEEFLTTFEPALSSQVLILRQFQTEIPPPIVEPRLLKLAIFNVLQNALDAIKRAQHINDDKGEVTISISYLVADMHYEISISDNGPGITDESGQPLPPEDTQAIFDYGYSTKGEGGEGLGLNWVHSILVDFHDGGVKAENVAGGGAKITLWFRSMERKEARVGEAGRNGGRPTGVQGQQTQ